MAYRTLLHNRPRFTYAQRQRLLRKWEERNAPAASFAADMDAGFDAGEWSGPAHSRMWEQRERTVERRLMGPPLFREFPQSRGRECPFCHVQANPRGKAWHLRTCPLRSDVAQSIVPVALS